MAGTFSRRLHAFCAKQGIPIIEAQARDRKHELAQPYETSHTGAGALLLITQNRPQNFGSVGPYGQLISVIWPSPLRFRHFYFHLIDQEWGHVTIRMCGYHRLVRR
jgi:hypothetical protein